MRTSHPRQRSPAKGGHPWVVALALAVIVNVAGCVRQGEELLIATPWPMAERSALSSAFRRWAEATPGASSGPVAITWLPLMPGDDLTRIVRRRVAPDLVLGGASADYERLARGRWLAPIERTTHPYWCVSRRTPIVVGPRLANPKADADIPVTFDDFRHDPVALEWARSRLADAPWASAYARLVRDASHPRRIGRQPGAALKAAERGDVAPRLAAPGDPRPPGGESTAEWVEGVAVVRGGSNPSLAQEFVRFLGERGQAENPPAGVAAGDSEEDPEARSLLADLLGATLVDAQDELWAAWGRLEEAGRPARAEQWMTEAPPWPPASIDKMLKRGDEGGALLETLTGEIAPDVDVRAWLVRSWLGPTRPIDGSLLETLARAVDGRLAREPRFRAWLRSEWTAWARQRYRRVARLAGAAVP